MLFALMLGLTVSAAEPQAVVLVGRRTSLTQADANNLSQRISTYLTEARVPLRLDADGARAALGRLGLKDASACNGRKACLTELGRQLAAPWVITLSLSQVGVDRAVALELLRVEDGVVVEKEALIFPAKAELTADQLTSFATKLRERLGAVPPADEPKVEPPPVTPVLTPEPPAVVVAPLLPPPPPPEEKSRVAPVVLGIAGVAALGAATALLVSGLSARHEAFRTDELQRSPYSASEVQARAQGAAVQLGFAGGLAAAGLGLGAAAVISW